MKHRNADALSRLPCQLPVSFILAFAVSTTSHLPIQQDPFLVQSNLVDTLSESESGGNYMIAGNVDGSHIIPKEGVSTVADMQTCRRSLYVIFCSRITAFRSSIAVRITTTE